MKILKERISKTKTKKSKKEEEEEKKNYFINLLN